MEEDRLGSMIYCFDIDGTICQTTGESYAEAEPLTTRVDFINELYENGHTIKLFTARGTVSGIDHKLMTVAQLRRWGVKYHELQFGKPNADIYVDDRGISDSDFFREHLDTE